MNKEIFSRLFVEPYSGHHTEVEVLYQAFKARLMAEVVAQSPSEYLGAGVIKKGITAVLVDKGPS